MHRNDASVNGLESERGGSRSDGQRWDKCAVSDASALQIKNFGVLFEWRLSMAILSLSLKEEIEGGVPYRSHALSHPETYSPKRSRSRNHAED